MNNRFLLSFVELARTLHLRQLADRLQVTPATLSLRIKSIENSLGVVLFTHKGQRLVLTPAGKRLLPIAESIINSYSELQAVAKNISRGPEHSVRIGVIESVIHTFLPNMLSTLEKKLPDVKIDLLLDFTCNLIPKLLSGDLDLIICVGDVPFIGHLVSEDLLILPVHWIAHSDSKLDGSCMSEILKRRLFTQMADTVPYKAVVSMLNGLHSELNQEQLSESVIGAPSLAALIAMVRQNLGVSIMPGIFVKEYLDTGDMISLPMPQPRASLISMLHLIKPSDATLAVAGIINDVCNRYVTENNTSSLVMSPNVMT